MKKISFERCEFHTDKPSRALWGINQDIMYPLVYFRKPKWMTEDDFQYAMGCLRLGLDPYYEFSITAKETP